MVRESTRKARMRIGMDMVLPSNVTSHALNAVGGNVTQQRGGDMHLHYHGYEGQSPASMKTDARAFAKQMQCSLSRMNLSFSPGTLSSPSAPFSH